MFISVVIPSYNSEATIANCLDALKKQSYTGKYEIIVADSSIDLTPQIISEYYPDVTLIRFDKKTDPGTARNKGIGKAKGNIIAFVDSDCEPLPGWLEHIATAHMSRYRVVGGVVMNGNGMDDWTGAAGYMAEFREFLPGQSKREVRHIPTCNISYKKEVFDEYGYFQGNYYPQEDLLYNYSLTRKGEKIFLDPLIIVKHHHRSGFGEFINHQRKIGKTTAKVLRAIHLPGSFIARQPIPWTIAIPFLPIIKFVRTIMEFLRSNPKFLAGVPLAMPILFVGLVWWAIGFTEGVFHRRI